ncbi:MAG: 2-oxoacid:acceptor oxidoreductase subunit alpha [Candidatus Lindowbacteria bacterium]|nr:2-oxoacid:acceptor oxidoreductase subunit alpha [Candidatus Lindowbacteria bacterium]
MPLEIKEKETVTIRFAGDSGDGMQLTGNQFTTTSALFGNDIATLPDYPAEIRAPAGTLAGVSGFQIQLAGKEIHTPGDQADCLFAMNPAALLASLPDLDSDAIIVVNKDAFTAQNLKKAGCGESNPLEDGTLDSYKVYEVPITSMTVKSIEELGLPKKQADRCKNFFALGLAYWIFGHSHKTTEAWIDQKFGKAPQIAEANRKALHAGNAYGETVDIFQETYKVPTATLPPGKYRQFSGNEAVSFGMVTAANSARIPLYYASYPITPASDILHSMATLRGFNVTTFQAEDEIAAMSAAVGAAFSGALGVTGTSGPGVCLKAEAMGLGVITELPMVIVNVQRGGPSTGLPTKTEQSDLLQAFFGRNGESPLIIVAPQSPSDGFHIGYEAVRLALRAMAPVMILSDGYIANGAEPWRIVDVDDLPSIDVEFHTDAENFMPYKRDPETMARPWAIPGTPGCEHRIGGIEKEENTGNVSYDRDNHHLMCLARHAKIEKLSEFIPLQEVYGDEEGELLILGWGGTYGSIRSAVEALRDQGKSVSHSQLRYLNPFPRNLGEILSKFDKVLIPEINLGQLSMLIKSKYMKPVEQLNILKGRPFKIREIYEKATEILGG